MSKTQDLQVLFNKQSFMMKQAYVLIFINFAVKLLY